MEPAPSPLLLPIPEVLDGPRVRLRTYRPADAGVLLEAVEESRSELEPWLRWPRDVGSLDGARERVARLRAEWLLRDRLAWGVFGRDDGRMLGGVNLIEPDWEGRVFEVGYWLRRGAGGRGYMREALWLVTRLAFDILSANRVVARVEADNVRSRRVPEALGYVLEGTLRRDHLGLDGEPADVLVFALIPEDYRQLPWALDPTMLEAT